MLGVSGVREARIEPSSLIRERSTSLQSLDGSSAQTNQQTASAPVEKCTAPVKTELKEKFVIGLKRKTEDLSVARNGGKHKIRKYDKAYLVPGFTFNTVGNEDPFVFCV
ncbi:hypothetical protein ILYODFUR_022389 [Ilyodon furcidens]|uniref:Uncharacterized protein n=1 Tax=Ilyodon furcidens TaxID=33524 RepID=A0ABV0SRF9_9TELE